MLASACLFSRESKEWRYATFLRFGGMVDVDFLPCYDWEKEE